MIKVNNLIRGLTKAQIKMLGMVANIEYSKAMARGHKRYADDIKVNGIDFIELVKHMESKHRLIIFGTDNYCKIIGKNLIKEYEEKIVC